MYNVYIFYVGHWAGCVLFYLCVLAEVRGLGYLRSECAGSILDQWVWPV